MSKPLVHALVVNWNGMAHLRACFDSLCATDYPNARFMLIDNGSTDGSVNLVREAYDADPRVEVVETGANLGWSGGNNVGIQRAMASGAKYVFLLNNDTVTAANALTELVRMAEEKPECGALAAKMLLYDDPQLLNSIGLECSPIAAAWDRGIGRVDGARWNVPRQVIGACGGAVFLRVDALHAAGVLAEDFEIYLDDLDLCLRIWDAGYEVWSCPAAEVRHKFSATMGEGPLARRKYYLNTRNRFHVIARNYPVMRLPGVLAACFLGEMRAVGRALLNGEGWRVAAHAHAWCAALAHIPKAWRFRRQRGRDIGVFWPLLCRDHMFFPGVELPVDGWYRPVKWKGREFRPISVQAGIEHPGGPLRVTLACCYPQLGSACVEVFAGGAVLDALETSDVCEKVLDCPRGRVVFRTRRLFEAEATGKGADFGGWIAVDTGVQG